MSANEGRVLKLLKSTLKVLLREPITAIRGEVIERWYSEMETRLVFSETRAELFEVCMGFYIGKHTFLHFSNDKLEFFQNHLTENVKT